MITRQATFNRLIRHLLAQGERANNNGQVRYIDSKGRADPCGCLFPAELRYPDMEDNFEEFQKALKYVKNNHNDKVLARFTAIHDWHEPSEWKELFMKYGRENAFLMDVFKEPKKEVNVN